MGSDEAFPKDRPRIHKTSHPFDKHYFHGGAKVGGYAGEGYRDFPVHWNTYYRIMERQPTSVLELGCGRGYVLKRLADWGGIPVMGLEISEHCRLTRAIDEIITHDVTRAPWPGLGLRDNGSGRLFDLCVSVAFLEHIPEDKLPAVFSEMERTCARGLHGIDVHDDDGFDKTHCTIRPIEWWRERLPKGHEAVDKELLEQGPPSRPPEIYKGVKLNLGSFTNMFHGWRNVDCLDLTSWAILNGYQFSCWDIASPFPYDDGVVDLIHLSHVLEHFPYEQGEAIARECHRVMKEGAVLRVAVPDTWHLVSRYDAGTLLELSELSALENPSDTRLLHELLYAGGHRALYDEGELTRVLRAAGFRTVVRSNFRHSQSPVMRRETVDLYPELSLFVEAVR